MRSRLRTLEGSLSFHWDIQPTEYIHRNQGTELSCSYSACLVYRELLPASLIMKRLGHPRREARMPCIDSLLLLRLRSLRLRLHRLGDRSRSRSLLRLISGNSTANKEQNHIGHAVVLQISDLLDRRLLIRRDADAHNIISLLCHCRCCQFW